MKKILALDVGTISAGALAWIEQADKITDLAVSVSILVSVIITIYWKVKRGENFKSELETLKKMKK